MLLLIFAVFAGCFLVERLFPGWQLPAVPTWTARVLAVNFLQLLVVVVAGLSWEKWLAAYSVFHLSAHVPAWAGGGLGYLATTFVFYWWHRGRHRVDFLWRHLHQLHHSPQRIEVATAFYKHPLETAVNSVLGGLLLYSLLGLSPEAGALCTLGTAAADFFYHPNVRTPRWVGYVFQRPEMHHLHHESGQHAGNYGDLVCWDWLFGTYRNPAAVDTPCGFTTEQELRLVDMLRFRDVYKN